MIFFVVEFFWSEEFIKESVMNIRVGIKKWMAVVLSLAMLLGIASDVYRSMSSLAGTAEEPSVKAYADTEQLMNFSPTDEGIVANQVGRIKLGKAYGSDSVVEWYILGKDTGVDGANTAIFAAGNVQTSKFQENVKYTSFSKLGIPQGMIATMSVADEAGTYNESYGIYDNIKPTEVYINHYGASTLRQNLQNMAQVDGGIFTATELGLLQATTITTEDFKNKNGSECSTYKTTDVMYATGCDPKDYNITTGKTSLTYIGSNDSIKKVKIANLYNGSKMWLRTPISIWEETPTMTYPGGGIVGSSVGIDEQLDVRPATNLNLEGILFASSAKAANTDTLAGTLITEEDQPVSNEGIGGDTTAPTRLDAMTLRLRGSAETVGSVSCTGNTITATAAASNVALVVQGRNSGTDWYYSKVISGTESISTDIIKIAVEASVSGLSLEDIELSKCKIWLETPAGDGSTLSYAVDVHIHDYKLKRNSTHHWYECTADDCTDENKGKYGEEEHTFEEGKCTVCEYDINHQHNYVEVAEVPATCLNPGCKAHLHCDYEGCDAGYYSGIGALISFSSKEEAEGLVIPALGHDFKYDKNSSGHWGVCQRCGYTKALEPHNYEKSNTCTVCGYEVKGNEGGGGSSSSGGSSGGGSAVGSGATTVGAKGTWEKDNTGWKFKYTDGTYAAGKLITDAEGNSKEKHLWLRIGTGEYVFGSDGYLDIGWVYDDFKWYYCDENRGKLYGWFYSVEDGYWYYLDLKTGEALSGWQKINGREYYLATAPENLTYTLNALTNRWIYNNPLGYRPYGSMYVNTVTPDNHMVGADGAKIN